MKYYLLGENDQPKASWAIFEKVKETPKRVRSPDLPPVIYRFLGPQIEGEMQIKAQYEAVCCRTCRRYDTDAIYDIGFSDPVIVRIKGDFSHSQDRMPLINGRFLTVLQNAKVKGYETKPLGTSGWRVLRANLRVECAEGAIKPSGALCPECRRPERVPGVFEKVSELSIPHGDNIIFTTKKGWAKPLWDRYFFLTENVVMALKAAGISGGYCTRLWTDEEVRIAAEKAKKGTQWKPPGLTVFLNGKAK